MALRFAGGIFAARWVTLLVLKDRDMDGNVSAAEITVPRDLRQKQ